MSDIDKETLKNKKKELEAELNNIQDELDESLDKVKSDVSSTIDPLEHVRRHPLPAVGISILVGFLAGKESGESRSRRHRHSTDSDSDSESESKREKLTSTMWYEVKRLAARKAFSFISDYIDEVLER